MKYWLLPGGGRPTLVVRPREDSFGHQVYEFLMGAHMARHQGAALAFWRPSRQANRAVFELECAEVAQLAGSARAAAVARAWWAERVGASREATVAARAKWQRLVLDRLGRLEARAAWARGWRKRYKTGLRAPAAKAPADYFGLDFRVCYARHPLSVRLSPRAEAEAGAAARRAGIDPDARLAAVHVRESGFKQAQGGESPADAIRNARIETYVPALQRLVERGFTVVRIGDPRMTPLRLPGVVDLATSPRRTDALELWVLMRSSLFIAGDSGPFAAALLTRAPCLAANVTNVLGGYPVRRGDRYILKRVFDQVRGRELTLDEILEPEYFAGRKDIERYRVVDNTEADIVGAVEEMFDVLDGRDAGSAAQDRFHERADAAYNSPAVAVRRTRKGEPAQQLLGDGRIGRTFAEGMMAAAEGLRA
ncbi:MAG: TIGR04372 family glycosyltransferase [Vicinamibacterales bacterium]|nr:TIGR04372 family glycosyltransferase [Vicinamibacterales bacterium]